MSKYARRIGAIVMFAIWALVAWVSAQDGTAKGRGYLPSRPMYAAEALVPTLPHVLIAPEVPSGGQLVAMVARDIDADGDLDVVANDGSLSLFVWINDGTGRLTRREARHSSGIQPAPTGPTVDDQPVDPATALQSLSSFVRPPSIDSILAERSRPRSDGSPDAFQSAVANHRPPRAPPILDSLS